MTKKNSAHCTLILDRSGSMGVIRDDVIGGVNQFLKEQRALPGECTFTLVQFDSMNPYEVLCDFKPIQEAKDLGDEYRPRSNTPLYDAVGRGIVALGDTFAKLPETIRPEKVVFVTMTDGMENASSEYTKERVAAMTKEQREKYNWQFVYLGADHDAVKAAREMEMPMASAAQYSKANFAGAVRTSSKKLAEYRAGIGARGQSVASMDFDADDRKAMQ